MGRKNGDHQVPKKKKAARERIERIPYDRVVALVVPLASYKPCETDGNLLMSLLQPLQGARIEEKLRGRLQNDAR